MPLKTNRIRIISKLKLSLLRKPILYKTVYKTNKNNIKYFHCTNIGKTLAIVWHFGTGKQTILNISSFNYCLHYSLENFKATSFVHDNANEGEWCYEWPWVVLCSAFQRVF